MVHLISRSIYSSTPLTGAQGMSSLRDASSVRVLRSELIPGILFTIDAEMHRTHLWVD